VTHETCAGFMADPVSSPLRCSVRLRLLPLQRWMWF
jgi:hypothetical protein